jgi:hypothetical protein
VFLCCILKSGFTRSRRLYRFFRSNHIEAGPLRGWRLRHTGAFRISANPTQRIFAARAGGDRQHAESRGITVNYGDSALNRPASETLTTRYLHTRPISVDITLNLLIDEDPLAFVDPNGFSWLSSFFPIV